MRVLPDFRGGPPGRASLPGIPGRIDSGSKLPHFQGRLRRRSHATAAKPLWTAVACYRFPRRGLDCGCSRASAGVTNRPAAPASLGFPGRIDSGSKLPHSMDACGVAVTTTRGEAALDCGSLLPLSEERPRSAGAPGLRGGCLSGSAVRADMDVPGGSKAGASSRTPRTPAASQSRPPAAKPPSDCGSLLPLSEERPRFARAPGLRRGMPSPARLRQPTWDAPGASTAGASSRTPRTPAASPVTPPRRSRLGLR